jgi:two-component system, response regulator
MPMQHPSILVAEDDPEDCLLIKEALEESGFSHQVVFVKDGEELIEALKSGGPLPGLILLDLNMPRKNGRETLKEIKDDPELRHIPIVILSTSNLEEDVRETYLLGVNSFITKPSVFQTLVEIMKSLGKYWFEIVELPDEHLFSRTGVKKGLLLELSKAH